MNLPDHDSIILVGYRFAEHLKLNHAEPLTSEQWSTWQAQFAIWQPKATRVVWFEPQRYDLWRGEKTDSYDLRAEWALEQPQTTLALSLSIGGVNWENSTKQPHAMGVAYLKTHGN